MADDPNRLIRLEAKVDLLFKLLQIEMFADAKGGFVYSEILDQLKSSNRLKIGSQLVKFLEGNKDGPSEG